MKKIILSGIAIAAFTMTGVAFAQQVPVPNQRGSSVSQENRANASTSEANKNKATTSATSTKDSRPQNNKGTTTAEQHRSDVAKFVQTLLATSSRIGGVGEQVRLIAQEQASSTEKTVTAIEKVEQRSKIKTFLIGTDYKNLGVIRSEVATMQNRIQRLSAEAERMASSTEKNTLVTEIVTLGGERLKLEAFIKNNENVFSLFGWVRKIFE